MASLMEEIADALARDVLRAVEETGDENLVTEVSRAIGSSSTTTQEAFMTAVRVRVSEQRARRFLAEKVGADWPLAPARAGSPAVQAVPATPAPSAHARAAFMAAPVTSDAVAPSPSEPKEMVVRASATPEADRLETAAPETPPDGSVEAPEALDPFRIRPKIPAPPPQVKPAPTAPAPRSLEAALALATSLPRKVVQPVEPTTPVVNPYADIEMPDGDWG